MMLRIGTRSWRVWKLALGLLRLWKAFEGETGSDIVSEMSLWRQRGTKRAETGSRVALGSQTACENFKALAEGIG